VPLEIGNSSKRCPQFHCMKNSVAVLDPGSGVLQNPGSGKGFSGSRIPNPFFEGLLTIFRIKRNINSLQL
jgi:hypothetical protein